MKRYSRRIAAGAAALAIAAAVWLPSLSWVFSRDPNEVHAEPGLSLWARQLSAQHLALWSNPELRAQEIHRMRRSNAEWDFMGRSFLVWALAEMALRDRAAEGRLLSIMDSIIDETLALERERGHRYFLMDYVDRAPFVLQPGRSQFVDGEIALMLAARCVVRDNPRYRQILGRRVRLMVSRMEKSPTLSAESYPDECWTFCNVIALAAIRIADHLDGTDHSALRRRWIDTARTTLVDQENGILVSAYTLDGKPLQGPEGSSIWMVSHCLRLIDEPFANEQYALARRHLGRSRLGFGYAVEWPDSWQGLDDIDSGPTVPIVGASAGSSGLALVGAASFDDRDFFDALTTSLELAGFPTREGETLRYRASNQVGDAVILYAGVLGPVWQKVLAGGAS